MKQRFSAFFACLFAILLIPATLHAGTVAAGYELFQSQPGTSFQGVDFKGVPLGTFDFGSGAVKTGDTDTIIQRTGAVTGNPGDTVTANIQMIALQLVTTAPTTVFDPSMPATNYYITLDPNVASKGTMSITFTTDNTGTFTSTLDVNFDIHQGSLAGPVIGGTQNLTLSTTSSANWGRQPVGGDIQINGVNSMLDGTDTNQDFWVLPDIFISPADAKRWADAIAAATMPTPAAAPAGIVLTLGLAGYRLRKSQKGK